MIPAGDRDPTPTRTRGRRLQRLRSRILDREPLCRRCGAAGRTTPAVEIDHITPLSGGGDDREANLQPLCAACHLRKTGQERGWTEPVCPHGLSLDPDSGWACLVCSRQA